MCPTTPDTTGVSRYSAKCPLVPPGGPTGSASPSSPGASNSPSSPPASSSAPGAACVATYRTVGQWSGGFQGEVTVTAGGRPVNGWTVRWTLGSGQAVSQLWNGALSTSGAAVSVRNVSYNGALAASASTTFGFLGSGTPSTPALSCTSP
ncbi:cellulose binding domain-containing protein [Dactylosporangium matsuzakiense]